MIDPPTAAHAPGFEARFLSPRHWGTWFGLALLWLVSWLPWPLRSALAWCLGWIGYWTGGRRRRFARINLELCFPDLSAAERRRLLRRHYFVRMRTMLDYGILWWGSAGRIRRLVRLKGDNHFRKHHAKGRPIILLTCHSLGLDFGAARLTLEFPGIGLVKRARNPLADWLVQRGRTRFNAALSLREQGLRPIVRAVRGGAFFYYLPDEDLGQRNAVFAPFFGVPAATLTTLGRLARLCDAVVIPSFTYYVRGRYENVLFPPLEHFPGDSPASDAVRMNGHIEQLIQLAPAQYMWTMRLFKTRPDGGPAPYAL